MRATEGAADEPAGRRRHCDAGVRRTVRGAAAVLLLCAVTETWAHSRSVSYSDWTLEGNDVRAELRLPLAELNRAGLDPADPRTLELLSQRVRDEFEPFAPEGRCVAASAQARSATDAFRVEALWRCDSRPLRLRSRFLLDAVPGHLHLLQLHDGEAIRGPWALSAGRVDADWSPAPAALPPTLTRYLGLGAEHILRGWDHLAYLLVVLLGAATLAQLAWRITGFTFGHSVTLALATSGWVRPDAAMVEAFIALTIACTAAERSLAGHPRAALHAAAIAATLGIVGWWSGVVPAALGAAAVLMTLGASSAPATGLDSARTAMFGLFHGFGFAGALAALSPNAPTPALPLLGFNLGVEAGQLLFVLPAWWLLRRLPQLRSQTLATAVLVLGVFWFAMRISG